MNREEAKELLPLIQAFAEGKKIEYSTNGENWSETETPIWDNYFVYRVKPEPKFDPKSPWISIKDKLPYNNPNFIHFGLTNRVLVRDKKGNLFVAYMKKNKDNMWIWCNDNFNLLSEITHWMYIPKL